MNPESATAANQKGTALTPLLKVERLVKHFPVRSRVLRREIGTVRAVDDVTFEIRAGETLALVGETGSGKTTTGRCIARLLELTSGRLIFDGRDITDLKGRSLRGVRRDIQIIFQDPFASLDPRMRVGELIAEPLRIQGIFESEGGQARVIELLGQVGLSTTYLRRYPHELSGGQRQRVGIARALSLKPKLLILDEPVSALDVSIQAQVVNLLRDLQDELGLAYLFIAHDLAVVRHIANRVAVMYLGRIVEMGDSATVFGTPSHPYTQALISAVPVPRPQLRGRQRIILKGDIPSPIDPPSGCRFRTRCWKADTICASEEPPLELRGQATNQMVACFFAEDAMSTGRSWLP